MKLRLLGKCGERPSHVPRSPPAVVRARARSSWRVGLLLFRRAKPAQLTSKPAQSLVFRAEKAHGDWRRAETHQQIGDDSS
jgi:hypothetical protein